MSLPILSIFPFAVAERGKERRSTEHWPSGPAQSTARPDRPDAAAGIVPTDGRTTGNGWQWEWEWSGTLLVYGTPALDIVTSQFGGCSTSQCLTFIPNLPPECQWLVWVASVQRLFRVLLFAGGPRGGAIGWARGLGLDRKADCGPAQRPDGGRSRGGGRLGGTCCAGRCGQIDEQEGPPKARRNQP